MPNSATTLLQHLLRPSQHQDQEPHHPALPHSSVATGTAGFAAQGVSPQQVPLSCSHPQAGQRRTPGLSGPDLLQTTHPGPTLPHPSPGQLLREGHGSGSHGGGQLLSCSLTQGHDGQGGVVGRSSFSGQLLGLPQVRQPAAAPTLRQHGQCHTLSLLPSQSLMTAEGSSVPQPASKRGHSFPLVPASSELSPGALLGMEVEHLITCCDAEAVWPVHCVASAFHFSWSVRL